MNAAAAIHRPDGYVIQKISPELLVYEDYNNSSTAPTPQYGTTEEYNRNNGPNDFTPKTTTTNNGTSTGPGMPRAGSGSPGPNVVVRTTVIARIPLYFVFYGLRFAGNLGASPQFIEFQSIYTYPLTITYRPVAIDLSKHDSNGLVRTNPECVLGNGR
jgi:hypothetical protein